MRPDPSGPAILNKRPETEDLAIILKHETVQFGQCRAVNFEPDNNRDKRVQRGHARGPQAPGLDVCPLPCLPEVRRYVKAGTEIAIGATNADID